MKQKDIDDKISKIQSAKASHRRKFFYFFIGLGLSNLMLFSHTYYFCSNKLEILKIELDDVKKKINYTDNKV